MALTDTAVRTAKVDSKPRKLSDAGGLFLLVNPNGSRWWRLKYRIGGKEKLLSLGTYPEVSLKEARERRDEARAHLSAGHDPAAVRRAQQIAATDGAANSFEAVAREWFELSKSKWEAEYANLILHRLERDMFPSLGARPISEIAPPELLMALVEFNSAGVERLSSLFCLRPLATNLG